MLCDRKGIHFGGLIQMQLGFAVCKKWLPLGGKRNCSPYLLPMPFGPNVHRWTYLASLAITACALPVSKFATSVGLIAMALSFVLSGQWAERWAQLRANRPLQLMLLLYAPLLFSACYSTNVGAAFAKLELTLPLLLLPLVVGLNPQLQRREMLALLVLFVLTVLVATGLLSVQLVRYYRGYYLDVREISVYISHVHFALMLALAEAALAYLYRQTSHPALRLAIALCALWLLAFTLLMRSITGLLMQGWLLLVLLYFVGRQRSPRIRVALGALLALMVLAGGLLLGRMMHRYAHIEPVDLASLPALTPNGNPYHHDTLNPAHENGHRLGLYLCEPELRAAWNARSTFPYDSLDMRGQRVHRTLRRYLTSLGLTKDSLGLAQLDSTDIALIERSYPSVIYRQGRHQLYLRFYETMGELEQYAQNGYPAGTLTIRLMYWRAAMQLIAEHPWLGVGCGDIQPALHSRYAEHGLPSEHWNLPHNQFLTVALYAGLPGLALFVLGLVGPFVARRGHKHLMPSFFYGMMLLHMLYENPLDSHIGVTLMALFGSLLLFGYSWDDDKL